MISVRGWTFDKSDTLSLVADPTSVNRLVLDANTRLCFGASGSFARAFLRNASFYRQLAYRNQFLTDGDALDLELVPEGESPVQFQVQLSEGRHLVSMSLSQTGLTLDAVPAVEVSNDSGCSIPAVPRLECGPAFAHLPAKRSCALRTLQRSV